ncbi:diguanylate cyclase [Tahibacter amnicola]|uniref:diguanylate cyclase n=1 Tax=Tahibacter amnicola TaxID=2976241 RepID=A0ABY6BI76_9GAMM|nr:diguanylate cyclase [Tahibacter amnicola]UXI69489.1 diguanylate cyclase [Tahibacter amnicola]
MSQKIERAKVLVIDDQVVILEALRRLLSADDLEIHLHNDSASAVAKARAIAPAVILLDIHMNPINGLDVLRGIRAQPELADVPVVMLSAVEDPETKVEAFKYGANDYVVKLPSPLELNARVRYHANALKAARERAEAYEALLRSQSELEQRNRLIEQINRELAESVLTDTLTGLRNRRFLKLFLDEHTESRRASHERRRAPARTTVFLMDLDHFKQINDRLGHDAGDIALVETAARLRSSVRADDAVLRWGGEEFLIIARYYDLDEPTAAAQRLLEAIGGSPMQLGPHQETVTCSVGYAPFPWVGEKLAQASIEQTLSLADAACYLSKTAGRNRAFGVLPGPDDARAARISGLGISPATLRSEDGRGVRLVESVGPAIGRLDLASTSG